MYCVKNTARECDGCGYCTNEICKICGANVDTEYYGGVAYCASCARIYKKKRVQQMTVREYFEQVREMERRISIKHEQIKHLKELATRATSAIEAVRVGGTSNRSKMANAVEEMVDIKRALEKDIARLSRLYKEISAIIVKTDNQSYRELLTLRYLCNKKWEDIADQMHFDTRSVYRLHGKALAEVRQYVPSTCA